MFRCGGAFGAVSGAALVGALLLLSTDHGHAYCSEPSFSDNAPDAPGTYQRPDAPYCLNEYKYTGRHSCDQYEIDSFINEVNNYIRALNEYAENAAEFAREAETFANEASDYARCERDELVEEVQ